MTPVAARIAEELRSSREPSTALSAPALATIIGRPERLIRETIATETKEINRVAGGLICSKPGKGYWVCTDADEIIARHHLLTTLRDSATDKLVAFEEAVREFGLAGILKHPRKNAA